MPEAVLIERENAKSSQDISISDGNPPCLRLLDTELDQKKKKGAERGQNPGYRSRISNT